MGDGGIDTEVAMRATAGDSVENVGAYRCLCCAQRVFMKERDVFERCRSCDGSIFEPDWRCSQSSPDRACEIAPVEALDDSPGRQWSML
jgi:hypothetical protein